MQKTKTQTPYRQTKLALVLVALTATTVVSSARAENVIGNPGLEKSAPAPKYVGNVSSVGLE